MNNVCNLMYSLSTRQERSFINCPHSRPHMTWIFFSSILMTKTQCTKMKTRLQLNHLPLDRVHRASRMLWSIPVLKINWFSVVENLSLTTLLCKIMKCTFNLIFLMKPEFFDESNQTESALWKWFCAWSYFVVNSGNWVHRLYNLSVHY